MDFLGIGAGEIILILVLALILLGPGRIPEIARTLGKTLRAIKKASTDFTTAINRELETDKRPPPPRPQANQPAGRHDGNDQPAEPGGTTAK